MLNDEFPFGVVCEAVVTEDGAVVELRQTVDAHLMSLHVKTVRVISSLAMLLVNKSHNYWDIVRYNWAIVVQ